jgi:hypothetical protein
VVRRWLAVELKDVVDVVATVIQASAIVIGGAWAYFKFIHGRTFKNRAEVDVTARPLDPAGELILVEVTMTNTGLRKIAIGEGSRKVVQLDRLAQGDWDPGVTIRWGEDPRDALVSRPVFRTHDWVEPGETIREEVVLAPPEPGPPVVAYQVRLFVAVEGRKPVAWTANAVVPVGADGASEDRSEDGREPSGAAIRS